ncbi:hypothetical protein CSUB01_06554 [Colletotrichum sublineola]|uniref:Succinate dehydrogenase assembly factor 4, mitochondrial n=1 Tax=Colletotrichum sublineola TaxID=1173701 RepID=A0A066WXD1_COLSU|nr:hypothetical protein CSUB01_06554 [Colletotrichum sublineola]
MSRLLRLRPFQTIIPRAPPAAARLSSSFSRGPAPPRLPADQQAEFERLQREASAPAATPTPTVAATDEDTMHPNYVRGAPPEFEGDVNPRTGEVGGPKREPLRWGAAGDWSYNGRVTDF